MNNKLYVGNLSGSVAENNLQDLFSKQGQVAEINLMMDLATGRSRGVAYVTMATPEGAQAAIKALHSCSLGGRYITVNEARPQEEPRRGTLIGDGNFLRGFGKR